MTIKCNITELKMKYSREPGNLNTSANLLVVLGSKEQIAFILM